MSHGKGRGKENSFYFSYPSPAVRWKKGFSREPEPSAACGRESEVQVNSGTERRKRQCSGATMPESGTCGGATMPKPGSMSLERGSTGTEAERRQWRSGHRRMKRGEGSARHRAMQAAAQQRDNAGVRGAPWRSFAYVVDNACGINVNNSR